MNKKDFLLKFNISDSDFIKSGLDWDNLQKIRADYEIYRTSLPAVADYIVCVLKEVGNIKYLKSRIKDSDHLIDKIIRKKLDGKEVTLDNYKEKITDLIGVRALHLFKDEWENINDFILNKLNAAEDPIVYIRYGDFDQDNLEETKKTFREKGLNVEEHPKGYRSVHYVIKFLASNTITHFIEIQVRTIFEEGWSEIDHLVRYPHNLKNNVLSPYLILFNRLAGHADEMGTFVKHLDENERHHKDEINKLQELVQRSKMDAKEKEELKKELDLIKNNNGGRFSVMPIGAAQFLGDYPGRIYAQGVFMPISAGISIGDSKAMETTAGIDLFAAGTIKGNVLTPTSVTGQIFPFI